MLIMCKCACAGGKKWTVLMKWISSIFYLCLIMPFHLVEKECSPFFPLNFWCFSEIQPNKAQNSVITGFVSLYKAETVCTRMQGEKNSNSNVMHLQNGCLVEEMYAIYLRKSCVFVYCIWFGMSALKRCLCTRYTVQCTTLRTQHVVVISINVVVCKKSDHWIRTNMMNLRARYWIINWNFWPLNTTCIKQHKTKHRRSKTSKTKRR